MMIFAADGYNCVISYGKIQIIYFRFKNLVIQNKICLQESKIG